MSALRKILARTLREVANRIDSGNCEMTETEALDIMSVINHEPLSKEGACRYLNMSRSKFDSLIREGILPKGKKVRGFKELRWYKDELDSCVV